MRHFLLTAAAIFVAGSACAADLPSSKAPPVFTAPTPAFTWTGFYAGVEGGVDFSNFDAANKFHYDATYGRIGGLVGYNYQVNHFVIGLEGNGGGVLGGYRSGAVNAPFSYTANELSYYADIRGRVGYAVNNALFYVAGGVAFQDDRTKYSAGASSYSFGPSATGWTLAAGVDYAFNPNWIGRIEYRHSDPSFVKDSFPGGYALNTSMDSDAVLVALIYKFGAAASPVVAKY